MKMNLNNQEIPKFDVFLLKTNDSLTSNDDRYANHLINIECVNKAENINLLSFENCNLDELRKKLWPILVEKDFNNNLAKSYRSLIITSRQTVEAIENAFKDLCTSEESTNVSDVLESNVELDADIVQDKLIVYCVGLATATRFNKFISKFSNNETLCKHILIRITNSDKQNAKELSRLIVSDYKRLKSNEDLATYALYPCSSIRKDDLSVELNKENIKYDELFVYRTTHSKEGLSMLGQKLANSLSGKTHLICLVFFSPSGCDALFNSDENLSKTIFDNLSSFRFISVGPSTSAKLKTLINEEIYQLEQPSPEALSKMLLSLVSDLNN